MSRTNSQTTEDSSALTDAPGGLGRYAKDWMSDEQAARYVVSRRPDRYKHYDIEQKLVGKWLSLCAPGATVLDFPCGTGRFNELVRQCGHRLIRADRSTAMLAQARTHGPNDHSLGNICCDLAHPPFPDNSVDIMILWRIFHHLRSWDDRRTVLQQAARVARKYVIMSFYDRACLTYWAQVFAQKCFRTRPKLGGAIRTSDLLHLTASLGLSPVEIHHYRRFISLNSAACFRLSQ
ncbi:MAG TPA: class I SAM-dependent methyltransferase [Phycisphaerae bacterium]|nr:class I SAM-dependent methyltransferase [Phycisphaerae bacterium]HRR85549.1 class I SAM-dependent methyltransferase [Phycisphaerae bacterium]